MRCLCCSKIIEDKNDNSWHLECIKKFFDTYKLPLIDLSSSNEELLKFGENYVSKNDSVTGVQTKLSLHLSKDKDEYRLTLVGYPAGYILKPETKEYPSIARAEHLVMSMANECSIKTPMHALIKLKDNSFAYITKRIDRRKKQKIHMEDFCQLSNRLTEDKYHSSYEKVAKVIDKYSSIKNLDKAELFYRLLFCFVTCNSDMHLKNFSLMEENEKVYLSPFYDLLPVNILINDTEEVALTINSKKRNIRKNDFIKYGENIGLDIKTINKYIAKIISYETIFIQMINDSLLDEELKKRFITLMNERFNRLN